IFLLLISLIYDTNDTFFSVVYGVVFGLLIDIVYTGTLGVYMFVYPFTLYVVHIIKRFLQTNMYMAVAVLAVSLFIIEVLLMLIYSIVDLIEVNNISFLLNRFLPTLFANILFLIPAYLLSVNKMKRLREEQLEK